MYFVHLCTLQFWGNSHWVIIVFVCAPCPKAVNQKKKSLFVCKFVCAESLLVYYGTYFAGVRHFGIVHGDLVDSEGVRALVPLYVILV